MEQWVVGRFLSTLVGLQSFVVLIIYLIIVGLSPLYMRLTSPLSLRKTMIIYNYLCSLANLYALIAFILGVYQAQSIFLLKGNSWLEHAFYLYWVLKNVELADTFFMIVRHRRRQISFLQVYHHGSMVLLTDFAYHYSPWSGIGFLLAINCFIHVCLYFYYGYSAQFPDTTVPWKARVTQLQIAQFMVGVVHSAFGYTYHGYCIYGPFYASTMIVLFTNYYVRAFLMRKDRKGKVE